MSNYPTLNQLDNRLATIFANTPVDKRPEQMPLDPNEAAEWWRNILEPPDQFSAPQRYTIHGKDSENAYGFKWPYAETTTRFLKKFLHLPKPHQNTILAAREDKIFWRGDDIDFFMMVIDKTMIMREMGVEKHKKRFFNKLRNYTKDQKIDV